MSALHHRPLIAAIDDDAGILWSLGSLLESADYDVRLFASASAFLASGILQAIDCIISDLDMPGMDGFELLRTVRMTRPTIPVCIITGYPDTFQRLLTADDTVTRVFTKPFRGAELLAAVQAAIVEGRR